MEMTRALVDEKRRVMESIGKADRARYSAITETLKHYDRETRHIQKGILSPSFVESLIFKLEASLKAENNFG
jgi:hypothetical protein